MGTLTEIPTGTLLSGRWLSNRIDNPLDLMEDQVLTDLTIKLSDDSGVFNVHKLILVSHSEYFFFFPLRPHQVLKLENENPVKSNSRTLHGT